MPSGHGNSFCNPKGSKTSEITRESLEKFNVYCTVSILLWMHISFFISLAYTVYCGCGGVMYHLDWADLKCWRYHHRMNRSFSLLDEIILFVEYSFVHHCLQQVQFHPSDCARLSDPLVQPAGLPWADLQHPCGPSDSCCWFEPLLSAHITADRRSVLGHLHQRVYLKAAFCSSIKAAQSKVFM